MWIKKAGVIVDRAVRETRFKAGEEVKDDIEVLEMDELYTYIKKNLEGRKKEDIRTPIPEYGQLWIGTDLKLFRLK